MSTEFQYEQELFELTDDVEEAAKDYKLRRTYSTAQRLKNACLRLLDFHEGREVRPKGYGDTRDDG